MAITLDMLKTRQQDYLLARWENGELVLEPFCACGNILEEDYVCRECERECDCTFIACEDHQAMSIAEKLVQGNPSFRNFRVMLLDK